MSHRRAVRGPSGSGAPGPAGRGRGRRPPARRKRPNYALRRAVALLLLFVAAFVVAQVVGVLFGDDEPRRPAGLDATTAAATRPREPAPDAAPAAPRALTVTSHPSGASVVVEAAGGTVEGVTPFRARVAGTADVTVSKDGFESVVERVAMDRWRSLDVWLDPAGLLHHKVGEIATGSLPKQVAFSPDGAELWVTALGEPGIEIYDVATLELVAEVPTGDYGTVEVVFDAGGRRAYVSQMQTASVFEVDVATHEVVRELRTGSSWSKVMALSPDERTLYVENWSGHDVSEIDLATGRVRRRLPTVDTPRGLYVTPDGARLFVAGYGDGELQRIDLRTGDADVVLSTGGALRHLVGDAERGLLYADDMATDEVFVVDLATETARKLADTDHMPNTIDLTPDGRVLYVSNRGANNPVSYGLPGPEWGSVLALDAATGRPLDAIVGGNQTTGLDVSPDGRLLAFSDFLDNRVSVYEIPGYEVLTAGGGGRYDEHLDELDKDGA